VRAGDKKGQVAVWDHLKVYERTVYTMHRALTNNIRFFDAASALSCASASSDGKLKVGGAAAGEGEGNTAARALGSALVLIAEKGACMSRRGPPVLQRAVRPSKTWHCQPQHAKSYSSGS